LARLASGPGGLATTVDYRNAGGGDADGRYRILRPHARGGLGEVFVALDQELHREVALKEIDEQHAHEAASRSRFVREAEITGGLEHPGIVPVYGLGQHADGRPYYAMRFIQGETLREAIRRFHGADLPGRASSERSLALRQLLARFVAVCNAVAYAHSRGVLHRDLKPANIMLGKYGETLVVDWGLAKVVGRPEGADLQEVTLRPHLDDGQGETQPGAALGTPPYMSPEQAAGRLDQLGPAGDIYGLGATLYTLLTNQAPVQGRDAREVLQKVQRGEWQAPRRVKRDVPPELDAICRKAMALEPEGRYATALDLAADVEHWLADEPVTAWREPWSVKAGRWLGRHRTLVFGAATMVLVALCSMSLASLHASEMARAQFYRALAAQRQSKVSDQWNFFQTKRSRGTQLEATAIVLRAMTEPGKVSPGAVRGAANRLPDDFRRAAQDADRLARAVDATRGDLGPAADPLRKAADDLRDSAGRLARAAAAAQEKVAQALADDRVSAPFVFLNSDKLPTKEGESDDPIRGLSEAFAQINPVIPAALKEVDDRKTETQMAGTLARISEDQIRKAIDDAEERARDFDELGKPTAATYRTLGELVTGPEGLVGLMRTFHRSARAVSDELVALPAGDGKALNDVRLAAAALAHTDAKLKGAADGLAGDFEVAQIGYNMRRYAREARYNQAIASLYELDARKASLESDRHLRRSRNFFASPDCVPRCWRLTSIFVCRARRPSPSTARARRSRASTAWRPAAR
jgi:serine/threonine protein kinase